MGYEMNRTMAVSEPIESFSIGGNPSIIYNVKEFMGTPADNVGYTIYNYGFPSRQEENAYEFPNLSMKHAWQWDYGEEAPLLNDVSTYKKDPAAPSGYSLVKSEINEYVALKLRKFSTGINIVQNTSYLNHDIYWIELSGQVQYASSSQNSTFCIYTGPNPNTQAPAANMFFSNDNIFAVETAGYIASHLLTKKTEYIVSNNNHLTNTTEYTYDPSNILLKSQKTKSSEQNELITEYKYPSDFLTRVPYNTMVEKNMLTPVIEQTLTKNTNTLLQSTKTHFKFWNNAWTTNATNSLIVPEYLESKTLSNSYEPRLRYHSYDNKGNPTSVSKENDVKKAYIWGYNLIYPVAEVTGVDYNTIINSANLNQATINNPPNDEDLRAELNKIRQAFPSALVTTYTYKPLVGMTSQTDANGRTTYYEYDLFGRLKLIKDKNGNILKTFDYKYQQ
jgi:YD repeat-containing protein